METNPYLHSPLFVACFHPFTKVCTNVLYFVGNVPKTVIEALRRVNCNDDFTKLSWSQTDSEILSKYYGSSWKKKFIPDLNIIITGSNVIAPRSTIVQTRNVSHNEAFSGGNEEEEFGDVTGDASLDDFLNTTQTAKKKQSSANEYVAPFITSTPIIFSNISVYPTDSIEDIKYKYMAATKIAMYRMHMFYCLDDMIPIYPYSINSNDAPIVPDTFNIFKTETTLKIDHQLESSRSTIKIESYDTFITAVSEFGFLRRFYYIDLFAILDMLSVTSYDKFKINNMYYGCLMKLFPHIDVDVLYLAITDKRQITINFPRLEPGNTELIESIKTRTEIDERALEWEDTIMKTAKRSPIAVTAASVRIIPESRTRVNVRNIFDFVALDKQIMATYGRFDVDTSGFTNDNFAPDVRNGDITSVIAVKRHACTYQTKHMKSVDWFTTRKYNKNCVNYAISKDITASASKSLTYTLLSIHFDGYIEAMGDWKEDDRKDFISASKELVGAVSPVINVVNAMGPSVFPVGNILKVENCALGDISVVAFWPRSLSSTAFKELKSRLRSFETANYITIHGVQQIGTYAFYFSRGVVNYYDSYSEDDSEHVGFSNQYARLYNDQAHYKWKMTYSGRLIKITNRTTDVKVEFLGMDNMDEFEIIKRYIFSFLDSLVVGPNKIKGEKQVVQRTTPVEGNRRLKLLQEQDPELFDMKKHDSEATVYSVLCQSNRQPTIYNDADMKAMSAKDKAKLVKYWNFTTKTPAYYACPDKHYPYISFRPGQHPLGYCLPCCKKMESAAQSKAKNINSKCLANPEGNFVQKSAEDTAEASIFSRHVLAYNKELTVGRISEPPHEARDSLFLDAIPPPYGLYVIGVEQQTPAVANAGFAFSLSHILAEDGEDPDNVILALAELARSLGDTFHSVGGGAAAVFDSAEELAQEIVNTFVVKSTNFSQFGQGGAASETWPDILCDLARHAYGVEIVILSDYLSSGKITIEASNESAANITGRGASSSRSPPGIILLLHNETGTFPLVMLNPKHYLKYDLEDRWQYCRRIFDYDTTDDPIPDGIAAIIYDALNATINETDNVQAPDLTVALKFLDKSKYEMVCRLVDVHNRCYGIIICLKTDKKNGNIYFPLRHSPYPLDGTPTVFDRRFNYKYDREVLMAFIADFNRFVAANNERCGQIKEKMPIVIDNKKLIGFVSTTTPPLYFVHDQVDSTYSEDYLNFPYDPNDIDQEILNYMRSETTDISEKAAKDVEDIDVTNKRLANKSKMRNNLYKLFLAEFSFLIKNEKNVKLRDTQLYPIFRKADFKSHDGMTKLKSDISALLHEFVDDIRVLRQIILKHYKLDNADELIIEDCERNKFSFDNMLLNELRKLPSVEADKILREKMKDSYTFEESMPIDTDINTYIACREVSSVANCHSHCSKTHKLIVSKERLDDLFDILLVDIRNISKVGLLSASTSGIFDQLKFIKRPQEYLSIKIGK